MNKCSGCAYQRAGDSCAHPTVQAVFLFSDLPVRVDPAKTCPLYDRRGTLSPLPPGCFECYHRKAEVQANPFRHE